MPVSDDQLREIQATCAYLEAIEAAAAAVARYPRLWEYGDGNGGWLVDALHRQFAEQGFYLPDKTSRRPSRIEHITGRDGWGCHYCQRDLTQPAFEIDHVVPKSRGGTDRLDNLVLSCPDCNRAKGSRTADEWTAR